MPTVKHILPFLFILGSLLMSCDPCSDYVYIISNETDEDVTLIVNTDNESENRRSVGQYHPITIDNSQIYPDDIIDGKIVISPNSSISFTNCEDLTASVNYPPREENLPLWSSHSCIEQIYIGDTLLPYPIWRKHKSWHQIKKKQRRLEYRYTITGFDDSDSR